MVSYVKHSLHPDERIIYAACLHSIIYADGLATTVFGGFFGYFMRGVLYRYIGGDIAALLAGPLEVVALGIMLSGTLMILFAWVEELHTEIVITNHRLVVKYGHFAITTHDLQLDRISGVDLEQSTLGHLLGYGTIAIRAAGGTVPDLHYINNPERFVDRLAAAQALKGSLGASPPMPALDHEETPMLEHRKSIGTRH
jgi:hypothetical protein